jgi:hypothetical protein
LLVVANTGFIKCQHGAYGVSVYRETPEKRSIAFRHTNITESKAKCTFVDQALPDLEW